jgi:hypothetical protein
MYMPDTNKEPESYNSYKKRKFNEYKQKTEKILKGINGLSLKDKDKLKFREQLSSILSVPNVEASRVSENEQRENVCKRHSYIYHFDGFIITRSCKKCGYMP